MWRNRIRSGLRTRRVARLLWVQIPPPVLHGLLAQTVEHWPENPAAQVQFLEGPLLVVIAYLAKAPACEAG